MGKLRTVLITTALVSSLLVGGAAADAKGHSGGNSGHGSSGSSPSSSQSSSHFNGNSQAGIKETAKDTVQAKNQDQTRVQDKIKLQNQTKIKAKQEVKTRARVEAKYFKDTEKHWAAAAIQRLQIQGIVSGFPDGEFHPDDPVTQAQVIAMVMGAFDTEDDQITSEENTQNTNNEQNTDLDQQNGEGATGENNTGDELSDVPDWAKGSVQKALQKGILTRNMNRFHSQVQASRVQSMVWVAKALGLEPVDTSDIPFKDGVLVAPEDIGYVMALYNEGIIKGGPGGLLNPNSSITRAQIAAIIDRVLNQQSEEQDQNNDNQQDSNNTDQQDSTETSGTTTNSTTSEITGTDTSTTTDSTNSTATTGSETNANTTAN